MRNPIILVLFLSLTVAACTTDEPSNDPVSLVESYLECARSYQSLYLNEGNQELAAAHFDDLQLTVLYSREIKSDYNIDNSFFDDMFYRWLDFESDEDIKIYGEQLPKECGNLISDIPNKVKVYYSENRDDFKIPPAW